MGVYCISFKNMLKLSYNRYSYAIALFCIGAMFTGLLISRAVLSIALILFIINGTLSGKKKLKNIFNDRLHFSMVLLFIVPLVTGLWSSNTKMWWQATEVKLPFVLLPIGFAALTTIKKAHYEWLGRLFILLMLCGTAWSMWQYISNSDLIEEAYLQAKVIPTPFDRNHIYFSFTLAVTILVLYKLFLQTTNRRWKIIYILITAWFTVYLHILAAKTGLLFFYLTAAVIIIKIIFQNILYKRGNNKIPALFILFLLIASPFAAYKFSPTFKNRIDYMRYDYSYYSQGKYIEGLSDGNRVLSVKAGLSIFTNNIFTGVGFGGIKQRTDEWYDIHYPQMKEYERMLPSSEWLLYACAGGIVAAIIFITALLLLFFYKPLTRDISWWIFITICSLFFLYEVSLEGQFGVFVFVFFLWWWRQGLFITEKEIN
jgi:O-antigen ligase